MNDAYKLSTAQFAVWVRRAGLRLPYPLDISAIRGIGVEPPEADTAELTELADLLRAPRLSAFALRSHPDGTAGCFLGLAGADAAVLVTSTDETTTVRPIEDTELATGVVAALPATDPLDIPERELPEAEWNDLFALVPGGDTDAIDERFAAAKLPHRLAVAMRRAAASPVVIGVLGAAAWTRQGSQQLGPRLGAWYEYPTGSVLTQRSPARARTAPAMTVGPCTPERALRMLAAAVADAGVPDPAEPDLEAQPGAPETALS